MARTRLGPGSLASDGERGKLLFYFSTAAVWTLHLLRIVEHYLLEDLVAAAAAVLKDRHTCLLYCLPETNGAPQASGGPGSGHIPFFLSPWRRDAGGVGGAQHADQSGID